MESFGNFFDEEWHYSLSKMFAEDQDHYDRFSGQVLLSSEHDDRGSNTDQYCPTMFLPFSNVSSIDTESLAYVSDNVNPYFYHFFSQESSICSSGASDTVSLPYPSHDQNFQLCPSIIPHSPSNNACDQSIPFCMMDEINNSSLLTQVFHDDVAMEKVKIENSLPLKRNLEMVVDDEVNNERTNQKPKKRSRVSKDNKNKKNVQPKKNQKMNDAEECNNNNNGQSSSSCSSDDNLTGSQDLNGKTRASRGTATDPQSLYARKRRERINERLRILQNLVPNGTKVDISTMLEEAVEYVKFLKLQIQLLSSDDMWMYAPIAYNGMDMGLYQNINVPNL